MFKEFIKEMYKEKIFVIISFLIIAYIFNMNTVWKIVIGFLAFSYGMFLSDQFNKNKERILQKMSEKPLLYICILIGFPMWFVNNIISMILIIHVCIFLIIHFNAYHIYKENKNVNKG